MSSSELLSMRSVYSAVDELGGGHTFSRGMSLLLARSWVLGGNLRLDRENWFRVVYPGDRQYRPG